MNPLEWFESEQIVIGIIGALVGIVPAIIATVVTWLENRRYEVKRERLLQYSQKELDFLMSWLKAQEEFCTLDDLQRLKEQTAVKIEHLMAVLEPTLLVQSEPPSESNESVSLMRRLLLLYWPNNTTGWIFRFIFYMFLIFIPISMPGFEVGIDLDTRQFDLATAVFDVAFLTVFWGFPAILCRWVAVRADRRGNSGRLESNQLSARNLPKGANVKLG